MLKLLLGLHIAFGSLTLIGLLVALASRKGGLWHRRAGKLFSSAMGVSLMAALLLSVATSNEMLLSIAVFSAYLVYTGWRVGARRASDFSRTDRASVGVMLATAVLMVLLATTMLQSADTMGITVAVFALIGGGFAIADLRRTKQGWPTGSERLSLHVARMGGASIATLTAVLVVNVETDPEFIAWLLPTVLVTPAIVYWIRRVRSGRVTPGSGRP